MIYQGGLWAAFFLAIAILGVAAATLWFGYIGVDLDVVGVVPKECVSFLL